MGNAVCAFIIIDNNRFLLQFRDKQKGIFFPGHWGLFGGGIEDNELPEEALMREIKEEININIKELNYILTIGIGFSGRTLRNIKRYYYEVRISSEEMSNIKLYEGESYKEFFKEDVLRLQPFWPLDAYAFWLYMSKHRFI